MYIYIYIYSIMIKNIVITENRKFDTYISSAPD